jgi:hypothetical protein
MATGLFLAYAAVALGAGVVVVAGRSARVAVRALWVCLLAGCCAYVQMLAPAVAAVQLVVLAGASVAALRLVVSDEVVERRRWLSGLSLLPIAAAGVAAGRDLGAAVRVDGARAGGGEPVRRGGAAGAGVERGARAGAAGRPAGAAGRGDRRGCGATVIGSFGYNRARR